MIAHVAGVPVEELAVLAVAAGGPLALLVRIHIARALARCGAWARGARRPGDR